MASTDREDVTVERFAPNGGTVIGVLGALAVIAFVVGWAVAPDEVPLWVPAVALFGGVVLYTSTVRPRVLVQGYDLVLRNMLSTLFIPLASIEELAVRQVLAVRAGDKRYVCAGVGRSLRQAMKGTTMQRARDRTGLMTGESNSGARQPEINYADFVEMRLQELVNEDRARRGIRRFSGEAEELARQVRREPAWPEIAALVVTGVFMVVAFLVA